jgi:hypothetical protein
MKTKEEIKKQIEERGVNNFIQIEILLDIRELLENLVGKLKK